MGERAFADDVGALQFAPSLRQIEHMDTQHPRCQLSREIRPCERGHTRQAQCFRRQLRQAQIQQLADFLWRGQLTGCGRCTGRSIRSARQPSLQRFEDEQRVAAGMACQRLGPRGAAQAGDGERIEQRGNGVDGQWRQHHFAHAVRAAVAQPVAQRRRQLVRPHRHDDLRAPGLIEPAQQQFQRGLVGEVQVVDHQRRKALCLPVGHGRDEGLAQPPWFELADGRGAKLGQQA